MDHFTALLFLLWAGAAVNAVLDLQKRMIGGHRCKQDERLYHVKLTDRKNRFLCGGSLISKEWILTAAHCNKKLVVNAVVGVHPGKGKPEKISKAVIYMDPDGRIHDIMLLKLRDPVDIEPAPLPDCNHRPRVHDVVQRAGHAAGTFSPGDLKICVGESDKLQCADADVVDCKPFMDCLKQSAPELYDATYYQHSVCSSRENVDTCSGDSGGGVVFRGRIHGVHVRSGLYVCAAPMRHLDVCAYREWISETVPGLEFPE